MRATVMQATAAVESTAVDSTAAWAASWARASDAAMVRKMMGRGGESVILVHASAKE